MTYFYAILIVLAFSAYMILAVVGAIWASGQMDSPWKIILGYAPWGILIAAILVGSVIGIAKTLQGVAA